MTELKFPLSIKAEPIINALMYLFDDIIYFNIRFKGSFQRNYLNDIDSLGFNRRNAEKTDSIELTINRDGIYDKLPEGFFHELDRFVKLSSGNIQETSFKEEYEKQRNEIVYARKFFQPFDSFFFDLSLKLDKIITDHMNDPSQTIYDYFFFENNGFKISDLYRKVLIQFLPHFSKMKADIVSIKILLMHLFDAEVQITQKEYIKTYYDNMLTFNVLNQSNLSFDMYCGNHFYDFAFEWKIMILTSESKLYKYFENPDFRQTIDFVIKYLAPADIDTSISISPYTLSNLELNTQSSDEKRHYLGINTTL
jgi:hypothetical protein